MICIGEVLTVLSLFQDHRLNIVRVQKPNYEAHCSLLVHMDVVILYYWKTIMNECVLHFSNPNPYRYY